MTVSQEGGQQDAGGQGAWLDMSRYPDTDPDAVLSSDDHSLLTTSLAVDDAELPDAVWEHMLAVVVGDVPEDADGEVDAATGSTEPTTRPTTTPPTWSDDHAAPDAGDPGDDPAVHDPAPHDDGGWDGGWV